MRIGARALIIEDGAVLLVEFDDETGLHYNLPGGGVKSGESIYQALAREVWEEAAARVEIGSLLWVIEYEPERNAHWAGNTHQLSLIFEGRLKEGERPRLPDAPDPNQTDVKWIRLEQLDAIELLPHITERIKAYSDGQPRGDVFLQEPLNRAKAAWYLNRAGDDSTT